MEKKPLKVVDEASWSIEIYCDCPYCNEYIDLLDSRAGNNDDGMLTSLLCEEISHEPLKLECRCPECGESFIVNNIVY